MTRRLVAEALFANPAVTLARAATDTFTGIQAEYAWVCCCSVRWRAGGYGPVSMAYPIPSGEHRTDCGAN